MKENRVRTICRQIGYEPSLEEFTRVLSISSQMSRSKAEEYVRGLADSAEPSKKEKKDYVILCPWLWTRDDVSSVMNNKGLCKQVLINFLEAIYQLTELVVKWRTKAMELDDILRHMQKIIPDVAEKAEEEVLSEHHPGQGRLFGPTP